MLEVRVTDLYKGSKADLDVGGSIYVSLSRGAQQEGLADDEGGPSTITPVSAFAESIPIGSDVVVIANPVQRQDIPYVDVIDPDRGVGDGGRLLSGIHPQTLTFAARVGTNTWQGESLGTVESELEAAF